ncbi:hypothetical protein LOTGIDRAFT_163724 [Lottia gigantea]|uniref:Uncharacterized protein n=1 Tax=Lottia gigantea TaxID=225164 RepID=V3ZHX0_LOTGI|nr:hypothetical protein LOTGIDRAFT_163724 [Lottia gigantea]ESO90838.1 hypothetical protein LOTGIDRAFT_163724 [Lottia gigantea]
MICSHFHCLLLASFIVLTVSEDFSPLYLNENEDTNDLLKDTDSLPSSNNIYDSIPPARPPFPLLSLLFSKLKMEGSEKQAVIKRVFCNGFTGCGGRHRGRRRQYTARILKRPFCNNWGCGNGKRALEKVPVQPFGKNLARKRLFCNNYGGCRGGKKRTLYSNWLGKLNGVADNL